MAIFDWEGAKIRPIEMGRNTLACKTTTMQIDPQIVCFADSHLIINSLGDPGESNKQKWYMKFLKVALRVLLINDNQVKMFLLLIITQN